MVEVLTEETRESSLSTVLWLALCLRVLFLLVGLWLDGLGEYIRYTDVDYGVYHGAAGALLKQGNPYEQETYRYPPLLALLMIPNHLIFREWGKLIFIIADVSLIPAIQQLRVLRERAEEAKIESNWWQPEDVRFFSFLWAINPLSIVICTRGSSDSLTNCLLLWMLVVLLRDGEDTSRRSRVAAGLAFGLLVHMRIYPVIYMPALAVHLYRGVDLHPMLSFFLSAACSFVYFTSISALAAGVGYWSEAVLYHLTRVDHRHNFSVYFYSSYLSLSRASAAEGGGNQFGEREGGSLSCTDDKGISVPLVDTKWTPFIPQILLLSALALRYARRDLCRCLLLSTMTFVAFNKVITAQYFTWFMCLLPAVISTRHTSASTAMNAARLTPITAALLVWALAAGVWLWRAYLLEVIGLPTFLSVHVAGLLFHVAQVSVLAVFLTH